MTRPLASGLFVALAALLSAIGGLADRGLAEGPKPPSVDTIMEENFRAARVGDASAELTFVLTKPVASVRVMKAATKTKLGANGSDNMRIVWFRSPADVRGIATLTVEHGNGPTEILVYHPGVKKLERLLPANDKESYFGTDLSYADLIGFGVGDWRYQLVRQQRLDSQDDYVVVSVPATQTIKNQTGYGKRMEWIRTDNFVTEKAQYYDDGDRLVKIITAGDLRQVEPGKNRWQPMRIEARNTLTGGTTIIKVEDYTINDGLSADEFSARALERGP